jgi:adenylate cyclase
VKNRFIVAVLISIVAFVVINLLCIYKPLWQPFERRVYDLKYQSTLTSKRTEDVVIVDIDEKSLDRLGRFQNWPRLYCAHVLEYLSKAKVVGVDIFFGEPDTQAVYTRRLYAVPSFDSVLAQVIESHGNIVLVSSSEKKPIFHDIAQTGLGLVFPDDDGIVRRGFITIDAETTFAARVALAARPIQQLNRFLIYFVDETSFRRISFSDVYLGRVPQEYFNGKIVLIGGTAEGLFDYRSVPFDRHFPGIVLQANLVYNFINNQEIVEIPYYLLVLFALLLSMCSCYMIVTRSVKIYLLITLVLVALFLSMSVVLFMHGMEAGVIRPMYSLGAVVLGSLIYRYQFEEREKRKIKAIFSRYYSKELVDKVVDNPPQLGGEKVNCTVMFADIRNFTPYAEKTLPEEVGHKLNSFLHEMVQSIFAYQGRVDKFIGDCVMAVFGSPVKVKNHALNACFAAVDMIKKAEKLGLKIGIGINTGEVISGNFGSPERMEFTVIGDTVNLASRLEGVTKILKCSVICGPETYAQAIKDPTAYIEFKAMGTVQVKGKEEEIPVYTIQAKM